MSPRRLLTFALAASFVSVLLFGSGILTFPTAGALPAAGHDVFNVTAQVSVTSRLGQEVISLAGTASIEREDPHMEGGVEVADLELVKLHLTGSSLIGNVVVSESPTLVSPGELRSLQSGSQFPASSFIDAYVSVSIPANPSPSLTLHNNSILHLFPMSGGVEVPLNSWPPIGVTYALEPIFGVDNDGDTLVDEDTADDDGDGLIDEDRPGADPDTPGAGFECGANADCDGQEGEDPPANLCPPASQVPTLCDQDGDGLIDEDPSCIPLLNAGDTHMKAGVCVRDVTITIGAPKTPTPTPPVLASAGQTLSIAPGGPSGLHPASLAEFATESGNPGPVQVSGNDNFANAYNITSVPFTGLQNTAGATTELNEPLSFAAANCNGTITVSKGSTVWYKYTPGVSGLVTIDTNGSTGPSGQEGDILDTVLVVYTGAGLGSLTKAACDDDSGDVFLSRVELPVVAGTTYYIQAGGFDDVVGNLRLNVTSAGGAGAGQASLVVRITCEALGLTADGCDLGQDGDQDDLDAVSFGKEFPAADYAYAFSVAPGSQGLSAATGVGQQAACSPPQAQADEFSSMLNGLNSLLYDGDGMGPSCPTGDGLGLLELPTSDDLDAINPEPPGNVDPNNDGQLDHTVFFSLATGSPSLVSLGRGPADILKASGVAPSLYVSRQTMGLRLGDDIDALCVVDRGTLNVYDGGIDTVLFSLAAGSPTLAEFGLSGADILRPGPQLAQSAAMLGLRSTDDLDALACYDFHAQVPTPTPVVTVTPTPSGLVGDANCSGSVNAIDGAVVLQRSAGLIGTVPCAALADVNNDGDINPLDAALILQFVAGLLGHLPP